MKKATLFLTAILSTTAFAEDDRPTCETFSDTAEAIMDARQVGVPFKTLWANAKASNLQIIKDMTLMAYEQPAYSTEQYQKKATQKFADQVYVACVKSGKYSS